MTPTDLEAVRKRHAEATAEANGLGDYNYAEWCLRNAKAAHCDVAALLAHINTPPDQGALHELELLICNSEFHRGSHEDADALARIILQRFPGLGSGVK